MQAGITSVLKSWSLRGYCAINQELACFVLYLKTINTFLEKIIYASHSKFSNELKNGIGIKAGQAFLELLIKTSF